MQQLCSTCRASFTSDSIDQDFYRRMEIPPPTDCPKCRCQRRLMFRNFFNLYHRTCDLTGKKILSMYDKDAPFPVYEMHEWWGDRWDGRSYSREVNIHEPFFAQLLPLHRNVPRMSIVNAQCENTDYCTMSYASRNCYLMFGNVSNEDCAYGHIACQCKNCFDTLYCFKCELCYECIDCLQCYELKFCRDCDNCTSSAFLIHCTGCKNCFGCVGLKNKEHHIFNERLPKEEYEKKMTELRTGDRRTMTAALHRIAKLTGNAIVKQYHGFNCENVTGDYCYNCRNVADGYDLKNCEDCRYCGTLEGHHDAHDCNFVMRQAELSYNCLTSYGYNLLCCQGCMSPSSDIAYCDNCYNCKDCFGCVGLKAQQYCILNKQYQKDEYQKIRAALVAHMRTTGEWGQFFPHAFSPFGYNETMAAVYFPLQKEQVLERGWKWKENDTKDSQARNVRYEIPDAIDDVSDDITKQVLCCEVTGKFYKIIPQELALYRQIGIPIPRRCPDQRHADRMKLKNPRTLWQRACGKCGTQIETTYSTDRSEIVYCEECYLKEVY